MLSELKTKVEDVINTLSVALSEVEQIEAKRVALEASQIVNTQREERLNTIAKAQAREREDILAQKRYVEEQSKNAQTVLNKISLEKEELKNLTTRKTEIDKDRLQLEEDKKSMELLKQYEETFKEKRMEFEKERKLFSQEKLAMIEAQKLLVAREANIKAKEEKLDRIERMTQI